MIFCCKPNIQYGSTGFSYSKKIHLKPKRNKSPGYNLFFTSIFFNHVSFLSPFISHFSHHSPLILTNRLLILYTSLLTVQKYIPSESIGRFRFCNVLHAGSVFLKTSLPVISNTFKVPLLFCGSLYVTCSTFSSIGLGAICKLILLAANTSTPALSVSHALPYNGPRL